MKIYLFSVAFCLFFLSCDKKNKVEKAVTEIPLEIKITRFDKIFFETPTHDLPKVKKEFPFFFPAGNDDSVWLNKMQDPIWRELYTEVQKKYADINPVKNELTTLFKHVKYYFPKTKTPKVITVISEMDYNNKVIYADSLVIISLELYLGKNHKFYQFPNYIKQNFEQNQIMPDLVNSFSTRKISPIVDKALLSQMIYHGKQLYLKDLLIPDYTDAEKIGYSNEQILWSQENEAEIWKKFVEDKLLFSTDAKLAPRFINLAPFSKFYLEIDNESPGRIGQWIGWQIVKKYVSKNPDMKPEEVMKTDPRQILEEAKYKPK